MQIKFQFDVSLCGSQADPWNHNKIVSSAHVNEPLFLPATGNSTSTVLQESTERQWKEEGSFTILARTWAFLGLHGAVINSGEAAKINFN